MQLPSGRSTARPATQLPSALQDTFLQAAHSATPPREAMLGALHDVCPEAFDESKVRPCHGPKAAILGSSSARIGYSSVM